MEDSAIGRELLEMFGEGDMETFLKAVNYRINEKQIKIPDERTLMIAIREVMDSEGARGGPRRMPRTELAKQLQDAVEYARDAVRPGGRRRKSRKSKKRARKTRRR